MANRFLNNIKVNDAYTLPSSDGTNGQAITTDGAGTLSFSDVVVDEVGSIVLTVKNVSGQTLVAGKVVHPSPTATPPAGNVLEVIAADNSSAATMPAIGIIKANIADGAEGEAVAFGRVSNIDTSSFSAGDALYVGSSGDYTTTKPTGTSLIQKIGIVVKSHASNGTIEVFGANRTNDVPAPIYVDIPNGNVGIGREVPSYKLDVKGDASVDNLIVADSIIHQDDTNNYFQFDTDTQKFITSGAERMRIDSSGNVGIGTTSPVAKLEVSGAGKFSGGTVVSGVDTHTDVGVAIAKGNFLKSNDGSYLRNIIGQTSGGVIEIGQGGTGLISDINFKPGTSGNINFYGSGSLDMRVATSGNVGIGTASPSAKLQISTPMSSTPTSNIFLDVDGNNATGGGGSIIFGTSATAGNITNYNAKIQGVRSSLNDGSSDLQFYTTHVNNNGFASAQRMVIKDSGNVGIGTTSPATSLDIDATDAIIVPKGTTAERPSTGEAGMIRYNSTDGSFEGYTTEWGAIAGSGDAAAKVTIEKNTFTATASQENFTITSAPDSVNSLQVYIDGVYQAKGNYTASGTTVTINAGTGVAAGTQVEIIHLKVVKANIELNTYTGDGSDLTFDTTSTINSENNVQVYIDGVYQSKDTYTTSGSTVTFGTGNAPPNSSAVELLHIIPTSSPDDNSVTSAKIADNAVTFDKIEDRYTAVGTITNTSGPITVDWSSAAVYKMNAAITAAIEFDFTNYKAGQVLTIYNLSGSFGVTLDSDAATSETFLKLAEQDYDGSATSMLQIECLADGDDAVFVYSVAQYASDTTI